MCNGSERCPSHLFSVCAAAERPEAAGSDRLHSARPCRRGSGLPGRCRCPRGARSASPGARPPVRVPRSPVRVPALQPHPGRAPAGGRPGAAGPRGRNGDPDGNGSPSLLAAGPEAAVPGGRSWGGPGCPGPAGPVCSRAGAGTEPERDCPSTVLVRQSPGRGRVGTGCAQMASLQTQSCSGHPLSSCVLI